MGPLLSVHSSNPLEVLPGVRAVPEADRMDQEAAQNYLEAEANYLEVEVGKVFLHRLLAPHRAVRQEVAELLFCYTSYPMIETRKHPHLTSRRRCLRGLYSWQYFAHRPGSCRDLDFPLPLRVLEHYAVAPNRRFYPPSR